MKKYPGLLTEYTLVYEKKPNPEFDSNGIPFGIQPDYSNPFLDSDGEMRSVYVYRPSSLKPMMSVHAMIVLTDDGNAQNFEKCLVHSGLMELSEKESFFLIFCVSKGVWRETDTMYLRQVIRAVAISCVFPGRERCHDYKIGIVAEGKGSDLAHRTVAETPDNINSMLTFAGTVSEELLNYNPDGAATTVWMVNPTGNGKEFWYKANGLEPSVSAEVGNSIICKNPNNRSFQVRIINSCHKKFDRGIILSFWNEVFKWNINPFSTNRGRISNILDPLEKFKPSIHIGDRSLGDNNHAPHDWLEFAPTIFMQKTVKLPLMIFLHGGACDAFIETANTELHVLGEKENFFTVYATATNGYSWNNILHPDRENDVEYIEALIRHMINCYPIDSSRVYISGFSNGSGMAQVFAASRPFLIAGVLAFNTRFRPTPQVILSVSEAKQKYDYRMPVYYSYGTKDAEYPLTDGCAQFSQIHFWKAYNNINDVPSSENSPSDVGAFANRMVSWGKYGKDGGKIFHTYEYDTLDTGHTNLYNYTVVDNLPHAVEPRIIPAGWTYLSRFSRNSDGSLNINKRKLEYELYEG